MVGQRAGREVVPALGEEPPDLAPRLEAWRAFNRHRPRTALGGRTLAEQVEELIPTIPAREAVRAAYDPSKEFMDPELPLPLASNHCACDLIPTDPT